MTPDKNEQQEATAAATVKVRNQTRRPVSFRTAGRTIRLRPGQTSAAFAAHVKNAPELRALCARGVLTVLAVGPPVVAESSGKEKATTADASSPTSAEPPATDSPPDTPEARPEDPAETTDHATPPRRTRKRRRRDA